ncbi:hypothetical protein SeSz2_52 [Salmonella phage SeSz-2]|uniref:Uncharacterized protein n=1 Tax=Salmonella phage SeSz-2 TaxID=2419753 RepID=A0A411BGV1_9CAUD|nr:hypothetical protein KGB43_gp52 [Salmonella phage SeSz-2]QAY00911.1 hypothetical protein SeSz2_52 [Salmonella phage SeSz-2]
MGKTKRKKQEYETLPPCEMSGMPQHEDVILTEAEWRKSARKCLLASSCLTFTAQNRRPGYERTKISRIASGGSGCID